MKKTTTILLMALAPLAIAGCGAAPAANDAGGAPCDGSTCEGEPPPESVCLEHIAVDQLDDGCGVFTAGVLGDGNDMNPGTKDKPVRTLQHAIELARTGRGRVFASGDTFEGAVTLPSGVDLLGGFYPLGWHHRSSVESYTLVQIREGSDVALTIEPARDSDTGATDGVSRIAGIRLMSGGAIGVIVQSGAEVEFLHNEILPDDGASGRDGESGWISPAPDGTDGAFGADACSAAVVTGAASAVSPCGDGVLVAGGKGGDGYPDEGRAGHDGAPLPKPNPMNWGIGGLGDTGVNGCQNGQGGLRGEIEGTDGAAGQGIGRITETGWEGGQAGDGGPGQPGGGGGGGGGRRGGIALCGDASKGGASGGAGGAGGCGGHGGKGGNNAPPTLGILVRHAKVTVRDTKIRTGNAGQGGDGGEPQDGASPGRGGSGGSSTDPARFGCSGGAGGPGAMGGYGGGGRGGDSIGIAYLDEDKLFVGEGVTFELGEPGKGGLSLSGDPTKSGAPGVAYETFRFPE